MRKEYIFAGIVIIVVVLIAAGFYLLNKRESAIPGTNITLAVSFTPLSAPFFIADEKGFFRDEGINADIREYAGGHKCLEGTGRSRQISRMPLKFQTI